MLLRLGLGAGVVVFTIASATLNYEHMKGYGLAAAGIVIAAELLKPLLPIALVSHATSKHVGAWCGTLALWLLIVFFSFVNSFGNTLVRHAKVKEGTAMAARDMTRPEHVVLRELAGLAACEPLTEYRDELQTTGKGKQQITKTIKSAFKVPNTACEQQRASNQLALTAEMTETKRRESRNLDVVVSPHTVTDGYIAVASMFGFNLRRHETDILTVLLWVLLCEIGSAFGGLAIPRGEKVKP
jgi:hypothetical protein